MDEVRINLIKSTKELLDLTDEIESIFDQVKIDKQERDFFAIVKPFAENSKQLSEQWMDMAIQYLVIDKPRHIYKQQIEQAADLISTCSVQAFYSSTSLKRFKNQLQSIRYSLEGFLTHLDGS